MIHKTAKIALIPFFLSILLFSGAVCAESVASSGIFEYTPASYQAKLSGMYSEAMDYNNPAVISFAFLRISPENGGNFSVSQACDLWDNVNKDWIIITDPRGPEYISSASGTIRAGLRGDCDDYSVFLSSAIMSLGGRCRIVTAQSGGNSPGHAYPELFIGNDRSEIITALKYVAFRYGCEKVYYSVTQESGETSYWLNLDWGIPRYYGANYYAYGDNTAETELYHPGKIYYQSDSVTEYYADGEWVNDYPGYGYYMRKNFGMDTLNEL